jgi:DNA-binding MarR family transcriptional regulator
MRVYSRIMAPDPVELDELPCLCSSLRRATRLVAGIYDRELAPHDLRTTEYALLARLSVNGPMALTPFAARLGMDRSTLTRELRPLQERSLVLVEPGEDRRQRVAALTAAGEAALDEARPAWRSAQREVRRLFGRDRTDALLGELHELAGAARA